MKQRKSSFELLRILSMLLIIMHHFSIHTSWHIVPGLYYSKALIEFFSIGGKIGVNCFILISAYFMITKNAKSKALFKTWRTTLFYSIVIYCMLLPLYPQNLTLAPAIRSFFPVIKASYWFVSVYILLYIFSPYLNILLNSLSKKDYQKLILIQFTIFSVIATFVRTPMISNQFLWGLFVYIIGGYIRLHLDFKLTKKKLLVYLLISIILTLLAIITLDFLSTYAPSLSGKEQFAFSDTQGFLPLISSILIFLIFKQIDIGSISWINAIAPTMFSVYLIHDNFLIRPLLWHYVKSFTSSNPISILIVGFAAPLTILVLCSLIDLIRIQIVSLSIKLFKSIKKESIKS